MKQPENCQWFEDSLSAYIDKEIDESSRIRFDEHCCHCQQCRELVTQYNSLGKLMHQSESTVDVEAVWERVLPTIEASEPDSTLVKSLSKWWGYALFVTAASIAFVWFTYNSSWHFDHEDRGSHDHASLAVDFQKVVTIAKSEPKTAILNLASKYQGQEVGREGAIDYLGYEPAIFSSIPDGFTRVSTHVLNMPCCKCSATICQRQDDKPLIIFEHKDEQPIWFGNSPAIETLCNGQKCRIVELDGQLAVSWRNEDRQLTLIGATDLAEVNLWIEQMKL